MPISRRTEGRPSGAPDSAAAPERGRPRRAPHDASEHSALGERLIAGVPARIMRPRLAFLASLLAILAFGLLMVYSASSVEALSEYGSSTYFLVRQGIFIAVGLAGMLLIATIVPLDFMRSGAMWGVWLAFLFLLVAVLIAGEERGGATRWIVIAGQQFQPSEFVKPVVIVTAAKIFYEYYEERSLDTARFIAMLGVCVAMPLMLIIAEPDLGSCLIIAGTVFAMCYFAGFSYKVILSVLVAGVIVTIAFIVSADYRMARVNSDPWSDPYDSGYQAVLAIMAFASGGLFGRGIGNSTMKYHYLPEAHNDYILAIIGEELGFFGMLIFFAVYALMVFSIFKIAEQSPTIQGKLIAYGSGVLIMLQFLINALGILGVTPMTGKPLPFISYGGSALIGAFILAALVLRVSLESNPKTVYDARRAGMRVVAEDGEAAADGFAASPVPRGIEGSTAGVPHPRSARRHEGFTVVDGMGVGTPDDRPARRGDAVRRRGARPATRRLATGRVPTRPRAATSG